MLVVMRPASRYRGAKAPERIPAGVLDVQLGVVAVRSDLYDRASNGAANGYERPACEVGGGIEFHAPRKRRVAPHR